MRSAAVEDSILGYPQQPGDTTPARFTRDPEIRPCIPPECLERLVHGWSWERHHWADNDKSWPMAAPTVLELWRGRFGTPTPTLTQAAGTRLLADVGMDAIWGKLSRHGCTPFADLVLGLFGVVGTGILNATTRPDEIRGTLDTISQLAKRLSQELQKLDRQSRPDYRGLTSLRLVNYLIREMRGFTPIQGEMFSPEQGDVLLRNHSSSVWRLVEEISHQAETSKQHMKLRPAFYQGQKVALAGRESLKREIKQLLRAVYGKPLNSIGADLFTVMLGLPHDREKGIEEPDMRKLKI